MHFFQINKKLLPMKLHYFLGISGSAPIVCFLSTMIRQRGYSAFIAGLIFTLLTLPDIFIRPTVGVLTDKYKCRKPGLMVCLTLCILTVVVLFLLPGTMVEEEMDDMDVIKSPLFWLFTGTIVVMKTGIMARSVLEDTICVNLLGENKHKYGEQRMWGAIGWGTMSVFSGVCIDWYSKGQKHKNYLPSFVLSVICYVLDLYVVSKIEVIQASDASTVQKSIKKLFTKLRVQAFFLWIVIFGALSALIWFYLFWYIEDLANIYHPETKSWIKTIQGFSLTVQCLGGEVPFFFLSSFILKRVDHMNIFSLMFFMFAVRFFLYSVIRNPILVLPVELMNGVTYALAYSALVSYADRIAPVGTEGTLQGIVGAAFSGIGMPIGGFVGGYLFDSFGSITSFKILSVTTLIICVIQIAINQSINRFSKNNVVNGEP